MLMETNVVYATGVVKIDAEKFTQWLLGRAGLLYLDGRLAQVTT